MVKEHKFFLYAIASIRRNYIYVGISEDIIDRFKRHNNGLEKTTAPYRPYILIYSEECANRLEARKKEIYFKNASGKRKLKVIANKSLNSWGLRACLPD